MLCSINKRLLNHHCNTAMNAHDIAEILIWHLPIESITTSDIENNDKDWGSNCIINIESLNVACVS